MSAKKKLKNLSVEARPTLTEDIIQIILEEFKEQLQNDDLQGLSKNIVLYDGLLLEDNLFKMDILGHNITRESRTEWETLFAKARVKHRNWLNTIKLHDSFEIFNKNEKGWFPVKVIGGPENGVVDIHFNGWGKKYDTTVTLADSKIVPIGTFCGSQKKNKVGTSSASSLSSSAVVAEVASSSVPSNVSEEKLLPESDEQPLSSTSEAVAPMEDAPALSRSGRVLKKVKDAPPAPAPKTVKKTGGGKKSKQIQKDFNDWICSICNMLEAPKGTELMCCDGPCRRSFHAECLDDENVAQMDSWLCTDCVEGMHSCFVCNRRGLDYVEVVKCNQGVCGKYYHPKCLEGNDLPFLHISISPNKVEVPAGKAIVERLLKSSAHKNKISQKPKDQNTYLIDSHSFKCPLHFCDTCFVYYGAVDTDDLSPCSYCPRAFHTNCIPPCARFNSTCLVCPLHPDMVLPGQALPESFLPLPSSNSDGKGSEYTKTLNLFFDQLVIPDIRPDANQLFDNHYRLQAYMKEEVESTPPNFKYLTKNNYDKLPLEKMPVVMIPDSGCDCREEDGCQEHCYNRLMRVECCDMKTSGRDEMICRVGKQYCSNRAIQKKQYIRSKIFKEGNMGLGLKSLEFVPKGRLVIEYMGEIIDEEEMQRRLTSQRTLTPNDKEYYVMELANGIYVDGKYEGNVSRFINHSCDPNCELQRWNIRGKIHIGIFAIRDILPGEPLSYDYQFDTQEEDVFKCYCGTTKCRGTMAPNKKDRLAKLVQDNKLTKDMRQKLIQAGMNKEKKVTEEAKIEDEWSRSYTGRCIPGDDIHEMKLGPVQNTFQFAKYNALFLVRNVLKSTDFLARKEMLHKKYLSKQNGSSSSSSQARRGRTSSAEGNHISSSRGSNSKSKNVVSSTTPSASTEAGSSRVSGRNGKRSRATMDDSEVDHSA